MLAPHDEKMGGMMSNENKREGLSIINGYVMVVELKIGTEM